MNRSDLAGRLAVVAGSSTGIERAIAERLAERGARVAIASHEPEAGAAVFPMSRAGSFVTGRAIIADPGATITPGMSEAGDDCGPIGREISCGDGGRTRAPRATKPNQRPGRER